MGVGECHQSGPSKTPRVEYSSESEGREGDHWITLLFRWTGKERGKDREEAEKQSGERGSAGEIFYRCSPWAHPQN